MDLVPHIPHLHGLEIQLQKMHIDSEPPADTPVSDLQKANGHAFGPSHAENGSEASALANGLTNGYGHSRPSTYA